VLMMDIDFFKKINDTHGHFIGDSVLEEVAIRIAQTVRPYDVVGRFGGEEFIVVAPNMRAGEAVRFGDRIRGLIETEPVRTGDVQVPVTISVGVALGRDNMDTVLRAADAALYRAKRGGRNRVELAEEAPAESAAQA
jgi:two-component system, cell cycle response regulator